MAARQWVPVLPPFVVGLLGSEVYASSDAYAASWGPVLGSLYYVPIIVAAVTLGARAGVSVAIGAGAAHTLAAMVGHGDEWANPMAQTALFTCVALMVATFAKFSGNSGHALARTDETAKAPSAYLGNVQSESGAWQASTVISALVRQCRNPVTSIEGAGWILADPQDVPEEERQELVGIIRKEAHRLNRVLSDVNDFAQPRPPVFRRIDVPAMLEDVIRLASGKSRGHVFSRDIPPDLPELRGDSEQLRTALLNLVMNSVQASPGGGEIAIRARHENGEFILTVQDDGPGIAPGTADKIFDPFFTTHEHSLGLGLPVALRIVTEHRGRIALDCQRSQGLSVSLILPVDPVPREG